jgi:hypothetical protein
MKTFIRSVTAYLATAATPYCLDLLKKLGEEDWKALAGSKVSPRGYTNATHYFLDCQAAAFFSKNASLPTGIDRKEAAFQKWIVAEKQCALTNAFLSRVEQGPHSPHTLAVREFLACVRKRVSNWLGPVPKDLEGRFGPGVTLCCRGRLATAADKMSVKPSTTHQALSLVRHLWEETSWGRAVRERASRGETVYVDGLLNYVAVVDRAEWMSVPKTAITDRSIEVGPSLNVFYQLAVGKLLKESYLSKGWDLRHAADLHRALARKASISGSHATIDLSSASDTVSKLLVRACLPSLWYDLLDHLRTKRTQTPRGSYFLEKFSGMGNGYTFELESVLFLAICQEVLARMNLPHEIGVDISVFGDDIIVPTSSAQKCIEALELLGFKTNVDKTFVEGPFRESCGGDFFAGKAVRPHYAEKFPEEPQEWIALANGLRRVAENHFEGDFGRAEAHIAAWIRILDAIPNGVRACRGPQDLGDIVIHDDSQYWTTRTRNSIRYIRTYSPVTLARGQRKGGSVVEMDNFWPEVQLASVLARKATTLPTGHVIGVTPRGAVTGYKHKWVPRS